MNVSEHNISSKEHKKIYFFIEEKDDSKYITAQCEECFLKEENGWPWVGERGNKKIICKCGEILNEGNNETN